MKSHVGILPHMDCYWGKWGLDICNCREHSADYCVFLEAVLALLTYNESGNYFIVNSTTHMQVE